MNKHLSILLAAIILVVGTTVLVKSQGVRGLAGLAVAQTVNPLQFNTVRDGNAGDDLGGGTLASQLYFFDGLNFDRARGDTTFGLDVDVTRIGGGISLVADDIANPTDALSAASFNLHHDAFNDDWDRIKGNNGRMGVIPVQGSSSNQATTGAANTQVTRSIGPFAAINVGLHKVAGFCSGGVAQIRVESPPATIVWQTTATTVGTSYFEINFPAAIQANINTQMDIILTACGAGNTGTLMTETTSF